MRRDSIHAFILGSPVHWVANKNTVPDRSTDSCMDPELPGTGLGIRAGQGEKEAEAGLGPPSGGRGGSSNPAEMEET
jgi:hypothetical protein